MKKKFFLLIFVLIVLLGGCKSTDSDEQSIDIKNVIAQYADDYTVIKEEDGLIYLCIKSPDFTEVVKTMSDRNINLDTHNLKKESKKIMIYKEYVFTVSDLEEEHIKEAFIEEVVYDMMIQAVQEIEYQKGLGENE